MEGHFRVRHSDVISRSWQSALPTGRLPMNSPNILLFLGRSGFEGDRIRDGQRDFCSGCRAAPNSESGAKFFRPFAHSPEPPRSLAFHMQHSRIDPATVVADDDPEALGGILKLDFNAAGSGVAECI